MPEVRFTIRWPDGATEECYSPSTAVRGFFSAGTTYPLGDFLTRSRTALEQASQRVEAKYGFRCTSAEAQLARIEARATQFQTQDGAKVRCLSIS